MPSHPNILLIILDTLRRDRLTAYDPTLNTSPHLAEFASRALRYTRAVAPAQWTIPAHASMFTGTYPGTHGVTQSASRLADATPTLAEHLRAAGYHTVAFCNNPLVGVLENGLQRGFEDFYNYASAVPYRPNAHRQPYLKREFLRWFRPHARRIANRFARSDALFSAALAPLLTPIWTKYINFKGSTPDSITDLIAFWTAQRAGGADRPVFAFVNLMDAHLPYHPPKDALQRVAPRLLTDAAGQRFMRRFNADGAAWASPPEPPLTADEHAVLMGYYDAEIAGQDAHIGRLLDHLRRTGAFEDTVIVIAADHGEAHGDHRLIGHGFNVHQELIHVPLIVHLPDGLRGTVEGAVSTRRLFHTLLGLAGQPDDGLSILPQRTTPAGAADATFSEAVPVSTFLHALEKRNPSVIARMKLRVTRRALYEGDHKIIMQGEAVEALYDIAADPAETRDLASSQPERTAALTIKALHLAGGGGATSTMPAYAEDDAEVMENLRALGYVE